MLEPVEPMVGARAPAAPLEAPAEAPQRQLRLVPPRRRRAERRRLAFYGAAAAVAAVCFGLVSLHVLIAQAQFRIDSLQQKAAAEQTRYENLRLAVAELEAPARIVSVAEGELGLVQPASVNYLPSPRLAGHDAAAGRSSGGPASSGGSGGGASGAAAAQGEVVPAPSGDADWPSVKPYLSGTP